MRNLSLLVYCLSALSLVACGEEHEGATGDPDASGDSAMMTDATTMPDVLTMDDASVPPDATIDASVSGVPAREGLAEAISAVCRYFAECAAPEGGGLVVLSSIDCERALPQLLPTAELGSALTRAEAGELSYDPEAFEACLKRVTETCLPIDGTFCPEAFDGDVELDGACNSDYDCAGDAYCQTGRTCPGTCVARSAPGEDCAENRTCSSGDKPWAICDESDTCRTAELIGVGKEGDDCGVAAIGNNLGLSLCETGLFCDFDGTKKCTAPIGAGMDCTGGGICEAGTQCLGGDTKLCVAFTLVATDGGDCSAATRLCDPQAGLTCTDGTCSQITEGAQGDPCPPGPTGSLFCDAGLVCRTPEGQRASTCQQPGATGDPCTTGIQCASGACYIDGCSAEFCSANAGAVPG